MLSHQGSIKKGKSNKDNENADSIKVVCRFRPPKAASINRRESLRAPGKPSENTRKIDSFKLYEERSEIEYVSDFSDNKLFKFDKVFGGDSTQSEVFNEVSGVVQSVMAGFNGTVMAYGQTSAGKSWTMEGSSIWDNDNQGVIPRCIDNLFDEINNSESDIQFQLTISFFEIYCEKVRDLLNPQAFNLKIRETKNNGFVVQDVTEIACTDRDSVLRVIELGKTNRASAPTLMNAESSRSHSIVSVLVHQQSLTTGRNKSGRLFLVDLAGSEKVSKTGASGVRLEEAKNINSSLTSLGMVINALCDHAPHVPYRDSKLTMILMEALGGNSKTTLIICCNPEADHTPESLTTLRFGERAKRIKNNAKINEELSAEELKVLLNVAKKEIALLKKKLANYTGGAGGTNTSSPSMNLSSIDTTLDDELLQIDLTVTNGLPQDASFLLNKGNDFTAQDELLSLNAKIVSLEEELDTEKIRYKEEHENSLLYVSECEALKSTIEELEARLLKVNLEARRHSVHSNDQTSPRTNTIDSLNVSEKDSLKGVDIDLSGKDANGNGSAAETEEAPENAHPRDGIKHLVRDLSVLTMVPEETDSATYSELTSPTASNTAANASNASITTGKSSVYAGVDEMGNPLLKGDGSADEGEDEASAEQLHSQELARDMLILNEHSVQLRNALEKEIKGLEKNLSSHQIDTQSAQATAQSYAEKYIRLREEYESHVQRLMFKLTQEQQARTHVEDRLEDALHRLWRQSGTSGHKKGFLSSLYSAFGGSGSKDNHDKAHGSDRHSFSVGGGAAGGSASHGKSSSNMSDRELNISRSLELAQFRVTQLVAELEANKEAQSIVLETKESVMRSLARQNSQLTIERDNLSKRTEDLSLTVDQLTNLLRSVQARKMGGTPAPTPRNMNTSFIQGGGKRAITPASKFNFNGISSMNLNIRDEASPVEKVLEGDAP